MTALSVAFGKPESHKQLAKDKLSRRYQATFESSIYIEDVLRLCRRVDESEGNKIRRLFKGLYQEFF